MGRNQSWSNNAWEAIATRHTNWRLESLFRVEDKDIDVTHVAATQQQLSCTQSIATPVVSQCDNVMETVTQGTQPINAQIVSQCNDNVESVRLLQSEDCHAVLDNGAGHCTTSEVNSLSPQFFFRTSRVSSSGDTITLNKSAHYYSYGGCTLS